MDSDLQIGSQTASLVYQLSGVTTNSNHGRIFLGGSASANDSQFLEREAIKAVLTVASQSCIDALPTNCAHKVLTAHDDTTYEISLQFMPAIEFIESHIYSTNILIHCEQGISRSPTIAIAYIMYKEKRIASEVLLRVKQKRPEVQPNGGFIFQLDNFCKQLRKQYEEEFSLNYKQIPIKIDAPIKFFNSKTAAVTATAASNNKTATTLV